VKALSFAILAVSALQFLLPFVIGQENTNAFIYDFGFVPARYTGALPLGLNGLVAPITHMFLHGGWLHTGANVLSLMAFGAGLEKWVGTRKLLLLFFACGILGAGLQFALSPGLQYPMIGASGAISGLFGAMMIMFHDKGYMGGKRGMAALLPFALLWIGTSVFFGAFGLPGAEGAISWGTHVGGFLAGMALARPVSKLRI
jgi:membrane associated rhomboid family serine protease